MTWTRLCLATTLPLLAGCGTGTALLLVVDASAVEGTEQIHAVGHTGGELAFGPTVRPERASGPLEGPQTLRVLLPDSAAGDLVQVSVWALVGGEARGSARADVTVKRGEEVRVELRIEDTVACLGCDGCCDGQRCLAASVAACGAGGSACIACEPSHADRCSNDGRCACGQGPACDPVRGADRCQSGRCRCGEGSDPCEAGQECQNGVCRCTAASCAGCCLDNLCLPGTAATACGSGGQTCATCVAPFICENSTCVSGG